MQNSSIELYAAGLLYDRNTLFLDVVQQQGLINSGLGETVYSGLLVICCLEEGQQVLTNGERQLLLNILKAVKADLNATGFYISGQPAANEFIEKFSDKTGFRNTLIFGVISDNEPQPTEHHHGVLRTYGLASLDADKTKKAALWKELLQLFEINN